MKKSAFFLSIFFSVLLFLNCKNEKKPPAAVDQLGEIHTHFSGNEAALPHFEKGLKLLHNFEYDAACEAFLEAQEKDSTCVMAYWGEAMTYNHPLWRQQDYDKGQAALGKLAETPAERAAIAKTDLEKDFLQCMEIMYGPKGAKKERDSMYSKQLERMYKKYEGNEEVATFYALSLLGSVKVGRDIPTYEKGAEVVKGVLKNNPNHPGALHYLIHSYDDPGHAPKALPAAFSYSKVAADATHALHMPSHIFVAVGMWDEVVKSNIASWNASAEAAEKDSTSKSFGSYHALHWWAYGLLQQGRFEEAHELVSNMNQYANDKPNKRARGYLIDMKGNYLAESGDWASDVANFTTKTEDLNITTQALALFLDGRVAYNEKNSQAIIDIISGIEAARADASKLVSEEGIPMCSSSGGANRQAPNQADLDQAKILELELRALLAMLHGEPAKAEPFLKEATELEAATSYSFGPPIIVIPSYELYGNFLLEQGRGEEAAAQFDKALGKGPKRRLALQGRMAAAKMMKDEAKIKELEKVLAEAEGAAKQENI
ncbi:MAG: hypothetical protein AAFZ15_10795 [Bacteroidota bacterium]